VGRVVSKTPEKTKNYETLIRELFAVKYTGFVPLAVPVRIRLNIYRGIPKSESRKRAEQMEATLIRPITKPDASNVLKAVEDALNGLAFRDDSQIVEVVAQKYYSRAPRVEIIVEGI
jgi:Holliday junction resolvase RusA-like endonuclease